MNLILKIVLLFVICFVLFIAGVLIDSFLLSFASIAVFIGITAYLLSAQSKKNKQKKEEAKKVEREEKRIAELQPLITKKAFVVGTKYHKKECDEFFKILKQNGKLTKNVDYGMTKKNLIENYETDKVYEFEPVNVDYRLEHEKDNAYDTNAIKVCVSADQENYFFVGYISKEINIHLLSLLETTSFSGTWQGRKYKQIETSSYGDDVLLRDEKDQFVIQWKERNEEYYKYHSTDNNG